MRKVFRHADCLQKHEIHDRIIEFNTHTIITTNYDNLTEKAAEDNSEVIEPAKLDRLYDELKLFKSLNYVSSRYMRTAFRKAGLIVEGGKLSEYDPIEKDCESGSIIKNIAYEL